MAAEEFESDEDPDVMSTLRGSLKKTSLTRIHRHNNPDGDVKVVRTEKKAPEEGEMTKKKQAAKVAPKKSARKARGKQSKRRGRRGNIKRPDIQ